MKVRIAVLVIAALAAIGVLAGTASAGTARQTDDGSGIHCSWTFSRGAASFTCTNAAGATLSCNATWSWRPLGYTLTCTLPDGTVKTIHWP